MPSTTTRSSPPNLKFTAEPDRVAVGEKQIQLEEERKIWLYAAIDVDSKVVLYARLSRNRGTEPATTFLRELKEEYRIGDAELLVDGMGYLTALAKTDLLGDLNYTDRNIVEKLFRTYTMRIGRFHERWNGSQPVLRAWLTADTAYDKHDRATKRWRIKRQSKHSNGRAQSAKSAYPTSVSEPRTSQHDRRRACSIHP